MSETSRFIKKVFIFSFVSLHARPTPSPECRVVKSRYYIFFRVDRQLLQSYRRANVQGHTGSAVCRQVAGNFDTPEVQLVADGSRASRGRGETHPINHEQFTVVLFYVPCTVHCDQ